MDYKKQIKTLLQEAEVYRSHGLPNEAKEKYKNAMELINKDSDFPNKDKILESIKKKMIVEYPEEEIHGKIKNSGKMSSQKQDMIKNEFSFSGDKDTAILEGAIALARFGQYQRSLTEFTKLLHNQKFRVVAAKNILRCHIVITSVESAVSQYEKWVSDKTFPSKQIEKLKIFLTGLIEKKGVNVKLSEPKDDINDKAIGPDIKDTSNEDDDEFLDITSIGIRMESGPEKGKVFEFDVNFQSGNQLNFIVSGNDQELINRLKEGVVLKNVQFFSPISIFKSSGMISSKIMINSGPNKGDCSLDIKVLSG